MRLPSADGVRAAGRQGAPLAAGARPAAARSRSPSRWRRARRATASRGRGRSTAGSPGEPATGDRVADLGAFADDLAGSSPRSSAIDATGGPAAGAHSFFRGGPLATYDDETRAAIAALERRDRRGRRDARCGKRPWPRRGREPPVWVHGDVDRAEPARPRRPPAAVIDFGCAAVGDPACDLAIAWTFLFGESRDAFRDRLPLDEGTWARARGWALWKALITLLRAPTDGDPAGRFGWRLSSRGVVDEVLASPRRRP